MAAEEVLSLFESYWFGHAIFSTKSSSSSPSKTQEIDDITENPCPKISEEIQESEEFSRLPTIHVRSLSDQQLLGSKSSFSLSESFSPNSVLTINPKQQLQTILSGKEVTEFGEEEKAVKKKDFDHQEVVVVPTKRKLQSERKTGKMSKSLSDLEFEELKGFMDLGFVFTEEDNKDSDLVSIIPGLQRLGKKHGDDENQGRESDDEEEEKKKKIDDGSNVQVSRPYLSEAWDVLDYQKQKEKSLMMMMNWRIPALGNEIDMKEHLRFWAHSVASNCNITI